MSSTNSEPREVPAYEVTELSAARRTPYCVCVPVLNEGGRIRRQLAEMKRLALPCDVVIADGGSTDGSLERAYLESQGVRALLVKKGPGKLSAQIRMGFDYALRQAYRGVILIDGNDKDDPAAIPLFARALDEGFDFVQGSRFVEGGKAINTPLSRELGIKLVHAPLISLASRFRYTDTTNGFRGYSARFLTDPRVQPFRDVFSMYELHYYLAIRAARLGFRIKEVPVTRAYPDKGPTPTKISPIKGNVLILRTLLAACLHRFDPEEPRE